MIGKVVRVALLSVAGAVILLTARGIAPELVRYFRIRRM